MTSPAQARSIQQVAEATEAPASGVSWAAVIAGAFAAAALSLILLALGTGMGLSAVSPWSNAGASASAVSKAAIVWLILVQILASAMGGYLAGRLRTKWVNIHTHEVYFRDTAHGFLVWAVGLVITAGFLASAATSMVGAATILPTRAVSAPSEGEVLNSNDYFVDSLFRSANPTADRNDSLVRTEAGLIIANGIGAGNLTASDQMYLTQLVAARTGLTQAEAERRVTDVFAKTRQEVDKARKATAHSLYWMFVALLIGAFCASFAATIGGRQRDLVIA
jgi:hypothetical protein